MPSQSKERSLITNTLIAPTASISWPPEAVTLPAGLMGSVGGISRSTLAQTLPPRPTLTAQQPTTPPDGGDDDDDDDDDQATATPTSKATATPVATVSPTLTLT